MSKWRKRYEVHPAADVFPMMSDDELAALGEDIKANGQSIPVLFWTGDRNKTRVLIDGRNRLEAMERLGILDDALTETFHCKDPVTHIITLNIRRRHLTKQQQAELIVKAVKAGEKPPQHEAVSKGGRGKKNPVKQKAVEVGKEHGISKATVERAIAKANGKAPTKRRTKAEIAADLHEHQLDYGKAIGSVMPIHTANAAHLAAVETLVDPEGVEYPAQVLENALDTIRHAKAVAEGYRKIFKASSFDPEAKAEIKKAIKQLIVKWRIAESALDRKSRNGG